MSLFIDAYRTAFRFRHYKPFPMTIRKQLAKAILDRKQRELMCSMYNIMDDIRLIQLQRFINRLPIYLTFEETRKLNCAKKTLKINIK